MGALQWVDIPGYAAILFRRTLQEHQLPGALLARAFQWLKKWSQEVKYNGDTYTFSFPSGATLSFGYLRDSRREGGDLGRYLSTEFQFIGFDELTTFPDESVWDELNTRLRKTNDLPMPLRIRGASNPGDVGHEWVKQKFIDPGTRNIPFIKATVDDNPFIDSGYKGALESTKDPVRRAQLRAGDWDILPEGKLLLREWFQYVKGPVHNKNKVRTWDLAATEAEHGQQKKKTDPDYTVGMLSSISGPLFTIEDVRRGQWSPKRVEEAIIKTAEDDGTSVPIWFEVEPGASGLLLVEHYRRVVLKGQYPVFGKHATGDKKIRIRAWAAAAQEGRVQLVEAPWNLQYLREATSLGTSDEVHDDQMDATSLAFQVLTVEGENFEDWAEYYRSEAKGERRKLLPEQMSEAQYVEYLMQRERDATERIKARKAKEAAEKLTP